MEFLRPRFCISLLAILLSLSVSSTTNSDPTSAEKHDWKGGEGVKRLRVRRQNLNLPDTLGLPEKTYAFYFLWRLLSEAYDATNRTSAMPATNETTALKTFHTAPSPSNSPKTTQSEESQLVQQSESQTIPEASQVTELQNILDSTAFKIKIPNKTAEEPLTNDQEQINHLDDIADTNDTNTVVGFFATILSTPESQNMTELRDTLPDEGSTIPERKTPELSQDTEQHVLDSTTSIKITTKTAEEPLTTNHEQINHLNDFTDKNDSSTAVGFLFTNSSTPESQNMTELGDSQLDEQSTNPKWEKDEPEEPPSTNFNEQIDTLEDSNVTKDSSTAVGFFSGNSSTPDSKNTSELGTLPAEESTIPEWKTPEPSQDTEQYIPQVTMQHVLDSITSEMKSPTKTGEEPLTNDHEQINRLDNIADTNDSSTVVGFFSTISSSPESQNMTEFWNILPAEESRIPEQKTPEPSQDIEQDIPQDKDQYVFNYTTFEMKTNTSDEPSTITIYKQVDHVDDISTPDFTAIPSSRESQKSNTSSSSQEILQTTPLVSIPDQATIDRTERETPVQTAIDSHMTNYELLAPTIGNDIKTTSLSQSRKNEYPKLTPGIIGMVKGTVRTKESSTAKPEIQETPTTSHNGMPNQLVTAIDQTFPEPTPTAFTLEQQIHNSSSFWLIVEMPNEVTSDPELQKSTQSSSSTKKQLSFGTMKSHTTFQLVGTLTQPSPREKVTVTIPLNPKSSEKHISTTLVSQESSSTKPPHLHHTETVETQPDLNKKPTADPAPKKSYTNNNLMDKPTQSTTSRTTRTSTARLKTQTPSRKFIFKSAVSADDDTETSRGFFGLLFTLGCLVLLITALLILVAWRRWKAWHWMNNMWVAGPPLLEGTYHSFLQISNPQIAIEMKRWKTQKKRPESSEIVPESVALQSEHADEDFSEHHARPLSNT